MPRLRNVNTGAVVNIPDEKAAALGAEWQPVVERVEKPARRKQSK